jgi:D-glucosaminate-6-phosphate ammonia-lyase
VLIGVETIGVAADATRASPDGAPAICGVQNASAMYSSLGVRRVVNACGIYTDLGGSVLSSSVWAAAGAANTTWASMDELLDASGARVAALCGAPAARVVPGASAGIALSVAACIARGDGALSEALPRVDAVVLMQRGHEYKYARCAALAGARVEWVDDIAGALAALPAAGASPPDAGSPPVAGSPAAAPARPAAILHPAHLDAAALPLAELAPLARAAGVPVVVDAAYLSFPVSELERWSNAGDAACFSAKYFWGPNGGGFVAGRAELVADVAALDFTGYESGDWRTFGRAFKLDRASVVATVVALEEWAALDHDARLAGYAALAEALAARCAALPGARVALAQFTLDERLVDGPVNAVLLRGRDPRGLEAALAAGDPSIRAMAFGDALVFCTEALAAGEVDEIAAALTGNWSILDDG